MLLLISDVNGGEQRLYVVVAFCELVFGPQPGDREHCCEQTKEQLEERSGIHVGVCSAIAPGRHKQLRPARPITMT